MLQILKAKLQRAEHQERLAELLTMRKGHNEDHASGLLPGPSWKRMAEEAEAPVENIITVFRKESRGKAFDEQGRLIVLYEPHVAYKYAKRPKEAQAQAPDLFYPKWIDPDDVPKSKPHAYRLLPSEPYDTLQDKRWDMIARAAAIDFDAAIRGFSAGRFQQMTYWAERLDFKGGPMHLLEYMYQGDAEQFDVFLRYVRLDGLMNALRKGDWLTFARYNSQKKSIQREYAADCMAICAEVKSKLSQGTLFT